MTLPDCSVITVVHSIYPKLQHCIQSALFGCHHSNLIFLLHHIPIQILDLPAFPARSRSGIVVSSPAAKSCSSATSNSPLHLSEPKLQPYPAITSPANCNKCFKPLFASHSVFPVKIRSAASPTSINVCLFISFSKTRNFLHLLLYLEEYYICFQMVPMVLGLKEKCSNSAAIMSYHQCHQKKHWQVTMA